MIDEYGFIDTDEGKKQNENKKSKSMKYERVCIFCEECVDMIVVLGIEIPLNENILHDEETFLQCSSMYIR